MSEKLCQDVFAGYVCECFGEDCEVAMNEALAEAQERYEAGVAGESENSYNNFFNLVQKSAVVEDEAQDSSVDVPVVDDSSVEADASTGEDDKEDEPVVDPSTAVDSSTEVEE